LINKIGCTFIDPYPEWLQSLIRKDDHARIAIVPKRVQDVAPRRFHEQAANDILFIDSTHVAKIGSDVNHIIGNILPVLRPGVYVHFHDIFYPFEYPLEWLDEGRVLDGGLPAAGIPGVQFGIRHRSLQHVSRAFLPG
jgi:hypothetical protein